MRREEELAEKRLKRWSRGDARLSGRSLHSGMCGSEA